MLVLFCTRHSSSLLLNSKYSSIRGYTECYQRSREGTVKCRYRYTSILSDFFLLSPVESCTNFMSSLELYVIEFLLEGHPSWNVPHGPVEKIYLLFQPTPLLYISEFPSLVTETTKKTQDFPFHYMFTSILRGPLSIHFPSNCILPLLVWLWVVFCEWYLLLVFLVSLFYLTS